MRLAVVRLMFVSPISPCANTSAPARQRPGQRGRRVVQGPEPGAWLLPLRTGRVNFPRDYTPPPARPSRQLAAPSRTHQRRHFLPEPLSSRRGLTETELQEGYPGPLVPGVRRADLPGERQIADEQTRQHEERHPACTQEGPHGRADRPFTGPPVLPGAGHPGPSAHARPRQSATPTRLQTRTSATATATETRPRRRAIS